MTTWIPVLSNLLARYKAVLSHAWQERHRMGGNTYQAQEAQFLPAALALQETPISPAPRVVMWLLIAFAVLALTGAFFGKVDIVAVAQGKIVPNDRIKTIQAIETASVKAIHVADGQTVKAGDVLIELDETNTNADIERIGTELAAARLQAQRARAILNAIATGNAPVVTAMPSIGATKLEQAQRWVAGQYEEIRAKLAQIDADIARHEAELRSTQELVRKLERIVPLARTQAKDLQALAGDGYVSQHAYLDKEQYRIEQEGNLANQRSRLGEIDASLRESRAQRLSLQAEMRRIALDSLNDAEQKAAVLQQDQIKAIAHSKLMQLTAPVDGTVQQLAVHTVGGVVTAAQSLMMLVPNDHTLEVEAFLNNKDIGFVNAGHTAEVKVETFPYTRYGTIRATVASVSHDAINDEKRGLIYSMRVKMDRATMAVEGKTIKLSPGMTVAVEVKTGQRRLIEYFLSPLLQYQHESLRER